MAAPYDFSVGTVRGRRRAEGAGMATVLGAVMCVRSGLDRARRSCRPQVDRTPLLTGCAETKSWISGIMLLPGCREVTLDSAPLRFVHCSRRLSLSRYKKRNVPWVGGRSPGFGYLRRPQILFCA